MSSSSQNSIDGHVDEYLSSVRIGSLQIKIVEGEITEQSCDAIVCSDSRNIVLTGGNSINVTT